MGGPGTIDGKAHPETDNFQPCQFTINGVTFSSAENYFQWSKATNDHDRERILKSGTGITAWEAGQHIKIRDDWDQVKVQEMYNGNRAKFEQNEEERQALMQSGDSPIIFLESNDFWDKWNGLIMERIRAELRLAESVRTGVPHDGGKDQRVATESRAKMDKYAEEHRK